MAVSKIEDFGEKIGGARKDLAEFRKNGGFSVEQISEWTDAERDKYIIKKELFPTPDYRKMVDEQGYSREAAFYIKRVLDKLPTKPHLGYAVKRYATNEENRLAISDTQDAYIYTINDIKNALLEVKSLSDVAQFRTNLIRDINNGDTPALACFDRKALRALQKVTDLSSEYRLSNFRDELDKKAFLYSEDEKKLSNFVIAKYYGDNISVEDENTNNPRLAISVGYGGKFYYYKNDPKFMDIDNWKPNTYYVRLKGENHNSFLEHNFETEKEAQEFAIAYFDKKEHAKQAENENDKSSTKSSLLPPQLERINRVGENYREDKDITGRDMLEIFNFRGGQFGKWETQNDRQANLNMSFEAFKDLAKALNMDDKDISLGGELAIAYGARGRGNALAHYEPVENVINLTKMRGAGSLAHEFGHALDHAVAKFGGKSTSFDTDNYNGLLSDVMNTIKYKPQGGHSDFYKDACIIDRNYSKCDKGYWQSNVELFARAFATYVQDKLEPNKSDYLCGHAETPPTSYTPRGSEISQLVYTYPRGEERERINAAFDKAIAKLKELGMLHERTSEKEHALIEQQDGVKLNDTKEPVKQATVPEVDVYDVALYSQYIQLSLFDDMPEPTYSTAASKNIAEIENGASEQRGMDYNNDSTFDPSKINSITRCENEAEGYTVNGISRIPPEAVEGRYLAYVDFGDGEKWYLKVGDDKNSLNADEALDGEAKCVIVENPIYKATEAQLDQLTHIDEPTKHTKPKGIERD